MPVVSNTSASFIAAADGRYEPQRTNQFMLRLNPKGVGERISEEILCRAVRVLAFPALNVEAIPIEFVNEVVFVAGRHKTEPIEITLYDFLDEESAEQIIWDWVKKVYDPTTGNMGLAKDYKVDSATLLKMGPAGANWRPWTLRGVWPMKFSPGKGDMTTAAAMTMELTIQCDRFYRAESNWVSAYPA